MMDSKHVEQAVTHHRITNWRNTLQPGADTTGSDACYIGGIARLYSSVCDLYRCILPKLSSDESIPTSLYRKLERGYSSVILWSYDYGVGHGKLDLALAHSREIRDATISFLVRMIDILSTRLIPLTSLAQDTNILEHREIAAVTRSEVLASLSIRDGQDEPATSGYTRLESNDSLVKAANNLKTLVQALVDMGPLFDEPLPDEIYEETAAHINIATGVSNLVALIVYVYPKCDKSVATGIANALLRTLQEPRTLNDTVEPSATSEERHLPPKLVANAKTMTIAGSDFVDSALGTSIATSSYAETIKSYQGNSDRPVKIELPKLPAKGQPFRCEACDQMIQVTDEKAWKKHLMADAKPYMCIEPACHLQFMPFMSKFDWITHLSQHYSATKEPVVCPICQVSYNISNGDVRLISRHLSYHLEPLAAEVIIPAVTFTGLDADQETLSEDDDVSAATVALGSDEPCIGSSTRPALEEENMLFFDRLERIHCYLCSDNPLGFRGADEYNQHMKSKHPSKTTRCKVRDPRTVGIYSSVEPITPLSKCKFCLSGKIYGAYYDAAAHLRRVHFRRKTSSKPSLNARAHDSADPPMSELKKWMVGVEVDVVAVKADEKPEGRDDAYVAEALDLKDFLDGDLDVPFPMSVPFGQTGYQPERGPTLFRPPSPVFPPAREALVSSAAEGGPTPSGRSWDASARSDAAVDTLPQIRGHSTHNASSPVGPSTGTTSQQGPQKRPRQQQLVNQAMLDSMEFPRPLLGNLKAPPELKTYQDVKQWCAQNPRTQAQLPKIIALQRQQYNHIMRGRAMHLGQKLPPGMNPAMPIAGGVIAGQPLNMSPELQRIIQAPITDQEILQIRNSDPKATTMSDEDIRAHVINLRNLQFMR